MAKTKTLSVATTINTTEDTVITLPKSQLTISVKKGMSTKEIKLLDQYFSKHKNIPTQPNTITPNLQDCTTYYEYDWDYQNQYRSVAGKHLGIWVTPDVISWSKAYNTYGFNELYMDFQDSTSAFQAGFKPDSIMVRLYPTTPSTYITNSRSYGYYYFDEPIKNNISVATVQSYAEIILNKDSNSKCLISDDQWTKAALCNGYLVYDGPTIWKYLDVSSNMGVMCDLYYLGNGCGNPVDFWNEYFNYYNPYSRMNWLNNSMNNSGGWYNALSWAYQHINSTWLYANETGNESVIQNYCETAWSTGWLLRYAKQLVIVWKCSSPSPCTNCSYPSEGDWYVYDSYYSGVEQYVSF